MDTHTKVDREGSYIKSNGLTAQEREDIRKIFSEYSAPPKRGRFSEEGIENFLASLNITKMISYEILNCYNIDRPALRREQKKLLCALEKAIDAQEKIVRLETEATRDGMKSFDRIFGGPAPVYKKPGDVNKRIENMKLELQYRDLYQRRDRVIKELDNSKQGRPPAPEICLFLIRDIVKAFERHLGRAAPYYKEGALYKIISYSLTIIGYPVEDPSRLIQQALDSPA